ncbi:MAG: FMN-binding protein [Bacteroidales bacterium]
MKVFKYMLLHLCLGTFFSSISAKPAEPVRKKDSPVDTVRTVLPKTVAIQPVNEIWSKAVDAKGRLLGYVFNSEKYGIDIFGYYEDVPTLVVTDSQQKILKVSVINSYETEEYLTIIRNKGFFSKWNGKQIQSAKDLKVDAITGATLTTEAIIDNIKLISEKAVKTQPK